jgi:hypothetical protein
MAGDLDAVDQGFQSGLDGSGWPWRRIVTPDEGFAGDCLQDAMSRQPVPRLTVEQERGVGGFWNPAHV